MPHTSLTAKPCGRYRRLLSGARHHGFTLVELVMSISVMGVLMGGLTTAMFVAAKSMDGDSTGGARSTQSALALARVSEDMNFALSFSEQTSKAATFQVPDRDTNGSPEVIRYAWSGVNGDPLTVEYNNSGIPKTLVDNVHNFDLSYFLVTRDPPPIVQSVEKLLILHDNGPTPQRTKFVVGSPDHCAQCFQPTFPPGTVSWKITRVKIVGRQEGLPKGFNNIQIRADQGNGKPSSIVLEEKSIAEAGMTTLPLWYQFTFTTLDGLDPETGMCIVVVGTMLETGAFDYESGGSPMTPQTHFLTSTDAGATWSSVNDTDDMIFHVYGRVMAPEGY